MESTLYKENGLNVEYVSHFIDTKDADAYFSQLRLLPFYQPTLKIRGKNIKPKRLVLAYGDPGLTYSFSGTDIPAEPWTPLMLELRDRVEKYAACTFNYVLLNLYTDGTSYISQHKDNESGLDATFPIVVLNFGSERTIDFKKPHTPTTSIKLEHGSLYNMQKPTNKLFTHGIAQDTSVKTMRISLTFRNLISVCEFPPAKKQKLELSSNDSEKDLSSTDDSSEDSCAELCSNDWLVNFLNQEENVNPILAEWNLEWCCFVQIILDENLNLRIHIRIFKESASGDLYPTKKGVILTLQTWCQFQSKVTHLNFKSVNESFVANNQLLVACVNDHFCILQQIFPLNTEGFFLKPNILKLSQDQIFKLSDYCFEITESLIKAKFSVQLPKLIRNMKPTCINHLNEEKAKIYLLKCFASEVENSIDEYYKCNGCLFDASEQNAHECLTTPLAEKYQLYRQSVLLNLNLMNIVNDLKKQCTCFYYDSMFFTQINLKQYDDAIV